MNEIPIVTKISYRRVGCAHRTALNLSVDGYLYQNLENQWRLDINLMDAIMAACESPLSIADDVIERARAVAAKLNIPFETIVNEALRAGLDQVEHPAKRRRYKIKPHKMGLKLGCNLDKIQGLLAQIESEDCC